MAKVNKGFFVQNLKTVDERVLSNLFRLSAKVYNEALYFINEYYEQYNRYPTWNITIDNIKDGKNYKLLGNRIGSSVVRNLDINFKNYFKNMKGEGNLKRPGYRKKDFFIAFFGDMFNVLEDGTLSIYLGRDFQQKYNCKSFLNIPIPKNFKKAKVASQIRLEEKNGKYRIIWTYTPDVIVPNLKGTKMGIDLGMNQLFACYLYSDEKSLRPILISGRKIKSINHHMIKRAQRDGADADYIYLKKEKQIEHELNRYIKYIFKVAHHHGVDEIYVGFFKGIKEQGVARHFFHIPHSKIRRKIRDYGLKYGIKTVFDDESYTSKTSYLDFEDADRMARYAGRRVKRGLFRTGDGTLINADINGAAQILSKLSGLQLLNRDNVKLIPISIKV